MDMQAHISGQVSGQVPNQAGPQLAGLPQQNGSSSPLHIRNLGNLQNSGCMDPDLEAKRANIREKIYQILARRPLGTMQQKVKDLVKRLDEGLFKNAPKLYLCMEEYLNLDTLDFRLHALIRELQPSNRSQQLPHPSSSSIATMIPTPGITLSGSTVPSSLDNPADATSGYNNAAVNAANTGSLLSNANGASFGMHGGTFSTSDGALSSGYQQSPAYVSLPSSGNNMISPVVAQKIASQMIPTPGLSNAQSSLNSEFVNNRGGLSGIESTTVSQLQTKQYHVGQNSRILQNLGNQVGIGMRSSLQKNPSYSLPNGALNSGLGLIGNNMQMMNGPISSEGFMNASSATDISGSGNLYGTATSTGSMMNNQTMLDPVSMQCKQNSNSSMMANQPSLHSIKQTVSPRPQMVDQAVKTNLQAPHGPQQQMPKFQQQQFLQNPHQFQQQFIQSQHQKQQNEQHQILLKNDTFRQSQLGPNLSSHLIPEHQMESNSENLLSHMPEQFQLSDIQQLHQNMATTDISVASQIHCQQSTYVSLPQNPQQMPQILHQHQQVGELQNNFGCLSAGAATEVMLESTWQSQLQVPEQSLHEQHVQDEFRQRLSIQDEAQRPHTSLEGPIISCTVPPRTNVLPPNPNVTTCGRKNMTREQQFFNQRRWLLFLIHARRCPAPEGKCPEVNCINAQKLVKHIRNCEMDHCSYPRCQGSKILVDHNRKCRHPDCPVCGHVYDFIESRCKKFSRPLSDNEVPSSNGSWKSNAGDAARLAPKTCQSGVELSEDLQYLPKRVKVEHPSPSFVHKGEGSPLSVTQTCIPYASKDTQLPVCQEVDLPNSVEFGVMEMKGQPSLYSGVGSPNLVAVKKDESEEVFSVKRDIQPSTLAPNEPADPGNHGVEVVKEFDNATKELKQEHNLLPGEHAVGAKSVKPKIKGVSLTELFTPEQIKQHITGLRQWVGQSKAKAEKNQAMEHSMSENSCQLCAVEKLTFEPPPIYCTPCGARIKRNAMFYTMGSGDTRHYFCIPCYNEARGDTIEVDGTVIPKARLEKKRNDEETEEWWVQCDKCEAWQHQICALFNGRRNDGGQAEYTCPNCYVGEIERGERKPLPQSAVLGAKDLPRTILSDQIEQRLFRKLKLERQERARHQGKSFDEVPGAEALVIRVVSSVDKKLEVKQRFLEIFQEENYPTEFPYKSKVILLFQKIQGVEVCLFGMYVQEFGSECQFPNQRRVYLSYLDSVKYFRPEVKTVTGEALRTFVYHEILIGYLEYCKKRGFTSCYIWACPPLKGEDYILYCHPEIQKTPKSDKLREWYLAMLRKAAKENVVVELTNLYDHFFVSTGECKAKVTAARLPYFDGDYWPGAAEDMINQLRQEEDGRKQQKRGKTKKTITKRALKAAGQTDLSGNASKDALLMQKVNSISVLSALLSTVKLVCFLILVLGETICPMKEDFIMVHLQHACTHCCHLMASGNRWVCNQCKNFQLCDRCHDAEQRLDERDRHPINSRDNHALYRIEVNDVLADTKDKDEILESEFFDTRQAFLSLCQGNHYQYDTLRRAKHSSMMVLYHLHNPTAPAFVTTCNICHNDVETGQGWRCEVCPDYDVCNACFQKDGGVDHPHKLTNHPSNADRDAQNKEARQKRVLQLRKMLDLLVHASQCRFPQCAYPNCRKVKGLFRHGIQCKTRASGGCVLCKKMWYLLQLHARACKESECHVPRCRDLKEHLRRLQQQSDSRRRAAVMEMMRQRAAEVAGNTG
ncbi:hypothetical protein Syun_024689 [Stephania yunnanensis]|uniref:histone acetyltransferase n=1 Tax=Stephania yunnanensis TaxID=152371 RepID=A0AAP0EZ26_9MAGN